MQTATGRTASRGVALAAALAACSSPATEPVPAPRAVRAFVRVELAVSNLEVGPPDRLAIEMDGAARLVRVVGVPPAGIGLSESRLRPDEVRLLAHALQGFDELPDHWGRIVPDDRVRRVRVEWAGAGQVVKAVGTTHPVDPRLEALIGRLERIARQVGEHPRQTIGLALGRAAIGPGRMVVAEAVITATGTAAVQAPGLAALLPVTGSLELWLEGADGALAGAPVVEVIGPDAPLVRLEPGASVRFELWAPIPRARPAPERVRAVVRWDGGGAVPPIAGELRSDPLAVAPVPAPALSLAWPLRVCAARTPAGEPALAIEACGCEDRAWCEVRDEGAEPVLVAWEDRSGTTSCTACRIERGVCPLGVRLPPGGAALRVNDTIRLVLETGPAGELAAGRCWDAPRPTGNAAELRAIAERLGGPRAR